jgi:hypothetical protein
MRAAFESVVVVVAVTGSIAVMLAVIAAVVGLLTS